MTAGPSTRRRQLGARLRRLREDRGLSLEEAGKAVGLSKQLGHLIEVATLPNVELRVLPFDAGPLASTMDTFMILLGPDSSLDVVYLESLTVSLYLEKPEEVLRYRRAFADIQRYALDEHTSLAMINAFRKEA